MEESSLVKLNVGGKRFITTKSTIESIPDSYFTILLNGQFSTLKDEKGYIFIDRNPKYFPHILDLLRNGKLKHENHTDQNLFQEELKFYGLINEEGLYKPSIKSLNIDPLKGFVHSRRKLMPTGIERLIWGQGHIKDVKSIQFNPDISMSAIICWENYMPLLRYYVYSQNIQIYLAPTADGRDTWIPTMQHIAIEGRTFVLSANQFVKTINMPKEHPLPKEYSDPDSILTNGGSVIIDPFGKIIAGPLYGQEGIIIAEIDTDLCIQGKMDFDVCGHYSRNDIFQLIIKN